MIKIPSHWSPEQADFVLEFLQSIIDGIWLTYEKELTEICMLEMQCPSHLISDDNTDIYPDSTVEESDIPF